MPSATCSPAVQAQPVTSSELTFIILARPDPSVPLVTSSDIRNHCPMIGDVNLFFKPGDSELEPEVECEVMIAGTWPFFPRALRMSVLTCANPRYQNQPIAERALATQPSDSCSPTFSPLLFPSTPARLSRASVPKTIHPFLSLENSALSR